MPLTFSRYAVLKDHFGLSPNLSLLAYISAYVPFTPSKSEQRLHPPYYRGCWHGVGRCLFLELSLSSSSKKELYDPKAFFTHAALLRQAFAHCARFPTAASRRSLDRVSVPVWRAVLSDPLDIVTLVGRYPANKLMSRRPLSQQQAFPLRPMRSTVISGFSPSFKGLFQTERQVVYVLLTRAPLYSPPEGRFLVRLACVKHAASVHSEPGSNSLVYSVLHGQQAIPAHLRYALTRARMQYILKILTFWLCLFPINTVNTTAIATVYRSRKQTYIASKN